MYAYIKGKLVHKDKESLVIDVSGIGYSIIVPVSMVDRMGSIGNEVLIYTYLHVREDAMLLYGFSSLEEKRIFEQLISISGVGPKAALSVISNIPASRFALAVITDDVLLFTKAQGIGKKTAQRIILELKDKLKKEQLENPIFSSGDVDRLDLGKNKKSEAVSALMMLGYSGAEANDAISCIYSEDKGLEDIIRDALKQMTI